MNTTINKDFILASDDIPSFKKNGFVILRGFLSNFILSHIQKNIDAHMRLLAESQNGFKRVGYDIFEDDVVIHDLLNNKIFADTLTTLTGRSLFYTQGLGFQIEKEKHSGFPWHIGTQSFGYHRGDDFGCSMWVPLVTINPCQQGGGMSYVPEHIISGQFMYRDIDPAIDRMMRETVTQDHNTLDFNEYLELRHGVLNSPAISKLLECFKCTDAFEPGDVFIFNKNVIHASEPLLEGEISTRTAFVMRFIDIDSRYDKVRSEGLDFPENYFGHPPSSDFHRRVGEEDGMLIRDSKIFPSKATRTLIKRNNK